MSTASRPARRARRPRSEAGYTFIEVMVALVIFTSLGLIVERTLNVAQNTERYLNAVNRTTRRGQELSYELFDIVNASRKMYQDDTTGRAYLGALDTAAAAFAPGARLPLFEERGILQPDAVGEPRTGNVLLFIRESDPAPCVADPAIGKVRYIDTYRFLCIHPHQTPRTIVTDSGAAIDLHVWRSEVFPSYSQILAIEDEDERRNVAADLFSRFGHDVVWDPNGAVDDAFYAIDAVGTIATTAFSPFTIAEDSGVSDGGRLAYANLQLARTDASSFHRRAVLTRDPPATWEPNGFEVKVVGASGSRKVWMNLVVETQSGRGQVAVHNSTLIASTRDL